MLHKNKSFLVFFICSFFAFISLDTFASYSDSESLSEISLSSDDEKDEEKQECSICLSPLSCDNSKLICGHRLHRHCLREYVLSHWKRYNQNKASQLCFCCPMCRAKIAVKWPSTIGSKQRAKQRECSYLIPCFYGSRKNDNSSSELLISLEKEDFRCHLN